MSHRHIDRAERNGERLLKMIDEKIAYWMGRRVDVEEHMAELIDERRKIPPREGGLSEKAGK
jgi:hypothetical protein